MLLSLQTDYALRVLLDIALNGGPRGMLTRILAERQGVPPVFLTKIIARLSTHGFVRTQRGKGGGVRLGRDSSQINLLKVAELFEGRLRANACTASEDCCGFISGCAIRDLWLGAEDKLRGYLNQFTLADLARASLTDETSQPENAPS